jgi:hypothetical protein
LPLVCRQRSVMPCTAPEGLCTCPHPRCLSPSLPVTCVVLVLLAPCRYAKSLDPTKFIRPSAPQASGSRAKNKAGEACPHLSLPAELGGSLLAFAQCCCCVSLALLCAPLCCNSAAASVSCAGKQDVPGKKKEAKAATSKAEQIREENTVRVHCCPGSYQPACRPASRLPAFLAREAGCPVGLTQHACDFGVAGKDGKEDRQHCTSEVGCNQEAAGAKRDRACLDNPCGAASQRKPRIKRAGWLPAIWC